jgi:hypothetical protein
LFIWLKDYKTVGFVKIVKIVQSAQDYLLENT